MGKLKLGYHGAATVRLLWRLLGNLWKIMIFLSHKVHIYVYGHLVDSYMVYIYPYIFQSHGSYIWVCSTTFAGWVY